MSSPYINHFIQPDSLIPDLANPQSWNRYSYVQNQPINYADPSGHMRCDFCDGGGSGGTVPSPLDPPNDPGAETEDDQDDAISDLEISADAELDDIFHPFNLDSDYYSFSIYHGFVGWLVAAGIVVVGLAEPTPAEELGALAIAYLLNGGVTFTVDRYGRLYVAPGLSLGWNSIEALPTVTLVTGNLVHGTDLGIPIIEKSSPDEVSALLTEFSTTHGACHPFFPCVGTTKSPAAPYDSVEFGAGFPGHVNLITASWGFGPFQVINEP